MSPVIYVRSYSVDNYNLSNDRFRLADPGLFDEHSVLGLKKDPDTDTLLIVTPAPKGKRNKDGSCVFHIIKQKLGSTLERPCGWACRSVAHYTGMLKGVLL